MNRKTIAIGLASAVVATMAVAIPTFAQGWGFGWGNGGVPTRGGEGVRPARFENSERTKPAEASEDMIARREAIEAAIKSGDYDAWVEAVGEDSRIVEAVSAEEFARYVQMWNLEMKARDLMEQAREIGEEIGLRASMGRGPMGTRGRGPGYGPNTASPACGSEAAD